MIAVPEPSSLAVFVAASAALVTAERRLATTLSLPALCPQISVPLAQWPTFPLDVERQIVYNNTLVRCGPQPACFAAIKLRRHGPGRCKLPTAPRRSRSAGSHLEDFNPASSDVADAAK